MSKILCIEDSPEFAIYLKSILDEYDLTIVQSLNEAFELLKSRHENFDLVLLDVSLPDGNGIKSLSNLKEQFEGKITPIFILTSDDDILSKVAAFGLGADDYMTKPPNAEELKARLSARLRTSKMLQKQIDYIAIGDLKINSEKMSVEQTMSNGKKQVIDLTPLEFKIFKLLATRPGQIYSRGQLIDHVWGVGKFITERTVDAHVSHLRKKISHSRVTVTTVINVGYKISLDDSSS